MNLGRKKYGKLYGTTGCIYSMVQPGIFVIKRKFKPSNPKLLLFAGVFLLGLAAAINNASLLFSSTAINLFTFFEGLNSFLHKFRGKESRNMAAASTVIHNLFRLHYHCPPSVAEPEIWSRGVENQLYTK
ncbi:unnamed protein product [Cuscuta epithymum]|uniref:Uncharacterized protein n=1 Tax=Cuscuta epithymum TaxID=186058 RepID=A0AAV0CIQ1_9ASTE|nr:unnamed protein product [Cuscuta epithymum]